MNLFAEPYGRPLRYQAVHQLVRRLQARTGIEFTLHMLRHSRATDLLRHGVGVDVVARLLTHRSSTTTSQTYIHLDVEDLRAELTRARGAGTEQDPPMTPTRHSAAAALRRGAARPATTGRPVRRRRLAGRRARGARRPRRAARSASPGSSQPWLREAVKRWARQRLATGCAFNTICAGAFAFKRFSGFLADCQPPVQQPQDIDRALLERYLALAGTAAAGRLDQGPVAGVPAGVPGGEPPLPLGAGHPGRGDDLPRRVVQPTPLAAPVHPGVRDGPTGIRRQPRPAAAALPGPDRADHRDRAAGRGRLRVAVRPAAHRQRRLAVPAVRQLQDARRAPGAAVGPGRRGDPRPAATTSAGRCPDGSAWLFPSRSDPELPVPYETLRKALRRLAAAHRPARRNGLRHNSYHPPVPAHAGHQADQLRRSAARDPTPAGPRQPGDDGRLRPAARHHDPGRVRTVLPDPGRRRRAGCSASTRRR